MRQRPLYVSPQHFDSLPLAPPFFFESVTTRVLPLRARVSALQHLIDRHANFVPPQVGRFRVALPYVYLMILDYGKLALEAADIGWLAQEEFMFAVPTNHYTLCGRKWVFQGIKWFSPYIFVDSDISMTLGRRVYGWPKLRIYEKRMASSWSGRPSAPTQQVVLTTDVIGDLYAGDRQDQRTLCEIVQLQDRSFDYPFDPKAGLRPWTLLRDAASFGLGMGRDYLRTLSTMPGTPARPDVLFAQTMNFLGALTPGNPDVAFDIVNLKQFRDVAQLDNYCYQALTAAPLRIIGLNGAGALGDGSATSMTASGGFRVRLWGWPMLPIVDTLGLEVAKKWDNHGVEIAELEPQLPFWYDVNMIYERGRNLAERSSDRVWRTPQGSYRRPRAQAEARAPEDARFNTTMGSASQAVTGPFHSLSTIMRVLPLLARRTELQTFINQYLNEPLNQPGDETGARFELWSDDEHSAYVYLIVTNIGDLHSETDDVGNWAGEDAAFYVPVCRYQDGQLVGVGLVQAITYVSSTARSITVTEIAGTPTRLAKFVSPPTAWLRNPDDQRDHSLLEVVSEVLPTVGRGQMAVDKTVLEIGQRSLSLSKRDLRERVISKWAPMLRRAVDHKLERVAKTDSKLESARMHALGLLTGQASIHTYALKQIRDIEDPARACYQALNCMPKIIGHVHEIARLPSNLQVRIQEREGQPIVKLLGLETTLAVSATGGHHHVIIPISPFWARAALESGAGKHLFERSIGTNWRWRVSDTSIGKFASRSVDPRLSSAARALDLGAPITPGPSERQFAPKWAMGIPRVYPQKEYALSGETREAQLESVVNEYEKDLRERAGQALRTRLYLFGVLLAESLVESLGPDMFEARAWKDTRRQWVTGLRKALLHEPEKLESHANWTTVEFSEDVSDSERWFVEEVHATACRRVVRGIVTRSAELRNIVQDAMWWAWERVLRSPGSRTAGDEAAGRNLEETVKSKTLAMIQWEVPATDRGPAGQSGPLDQSSVRIRLRTLVFPPDNMLDGLDSRRHWGVEELAKEFSPQIVIESILAQEWYDDSADAPRRLALQANLRDRELRQVLNSGTAEMGAYEFYRQEIERACALRQRSSEYDSQSKGRHLESVVALRRFKAICEAKRYLHDEKWGEPETNIALVLRGLWESDRKQLPPLGCLHRDQGGTEWTAPGENIAATHLQDMFALASRVIHRVEGKLEQLEQLERTVGEDWADQIVLKLHDAYLAQSKVLLHLLNSGPDFFVDLSIFGRDVPEHFPREMCQDGKYLGRKLASGAGAGEDQVG
ncbi:hypothetical protein DB30_00374 [Enhygromyxa salina]|uniref:Uncharacterized protein n=1 Tax=Enhygromyxa salina TaxID=215803 RepID=A0A0C1Z6N7_9BACT|nr:hypothetical protein [Enhygromyxa salina]KIG13279.1 hypothetical protein DB30_00374 [Enhygromyxa salina]